MEIETQANKKRIAKNTLILYVRMLLVMGVSLFTQRVVLDKLGASDYGIYGSVAGVVAMLGFLNGTLSTGTSRFLTFEIGRGNFERLKNTFSTAFYSHLILAIIVAVLLLTGGIWFVENKLIIPADRMYAAVWVLVISVFTTFVSITQVPYTAVIIARENMNIYAYVGLFEAFAKLAIAYLISVTQWDRLIFYAVLLAVVQVVISLTYRFFCTKQYQESHLTKHFDKPIFKEMLGFSSWSLIANISQILGTQGLTVVMNMFFSPVIVAAQTIGNQISNAILHFRNNFSTAINPQIIKLYSTEQYAESRKLNLETSVYIFDLMLLLCLPVIVLMEPILNLWLVEVPKYAVIFSQYSLIAQLLGVYNATLYIPMMASGKLKENSYASVFVTIGGVMGLYIVLKVGWDVMWIQYFVILQSVLGSFVVKPIILCKYIPDYTWKNIMLCTWQMIKVAIPPVAIGIALHHFLQPESIGLMVIDGIVIMLAVCVSSFAFMDRAMRTKLITLIKNKFQKK
ncbi:MAG: polysaccharide biosynthesis protein [Bacteroidales bacterium]|nr:polysaccharide biosynthesis protein [Bacteroidales bacterium]